MGKELLTGWEVEWEGAYQLRKIRISCVAAVVEIGFCGGLRGEKGFLTRLKGILKFLEDNMFKKGKPHVMVTLQGRFKWETGENWHMVPLLDGTNSGIEVMIWVGIWLEVILGSDR